VLNKIVLTLGLLLISVSMNAMSFPVNETVGDYRISFESSDNTIMVVKGWDLQKIDDFEIDNLPYEANITEALGVGSIGILDTSGSQSELSGVGILHFDRSINTTQFEENFIKNTSSDSFMRVRDLTIDGHKGIYIKSGNGPDDPQMKRLGLYWLGETVDGMANEMVLIIGSMPSSGSDPGSESSMLKVLNTVHVENIS
jgi:hypothetical protein